jgi:hypothetical protein
VSVFQQTPDGLVYVRTPGGTYADTLAGFALDNGAPAPALDAPFIDRFYEPGVRHALSDGVSTSGGPMPFAFGDAAIANIAALLAAQNARLHPPPPPPTPDQLLAAALAAGCAIVSAGTPALSATYGLDPVTQSDFVGVATAISLLGTFPGGTADFSYPDIAGHPVTFPDVAGFKAVFGALSAYILALRRTAATLNAGGSASWPAQPVSIP